MKSLVNIPFKCPHGEFSCNYVDTATATLDMDCNKCPNKLNNTKNDMITGYTSEPRLEYRMYCLVLRQLSGINKGIQGIHSSLEYANLFFDNDDFQRYVNNDKTLIMVDGGMNQDMIDIHDQLTRASINHSVFGEPDLNNCLTAICVLADERVWNREKYMLNPDEYADAQFDCMNEFPDDVIGDWIEYIGGEKNAKLIEILSNKRLSL